MNEKDLSPKIKRHLVWIVSAVCFFLIYIFFGYTGIVLFFLIFIPFWAVFSIIDGIRFLRYGKWYLVPLFSGNDTITAYATILVGIGVIGMWAWIIIFLLRGG